MRNTMLTSAVAAMATLLLFCAEQPNDTGDATLDTTVLGAWHGAIGAIPMMNFKGEEIFAIISGGDSVFSLITRDTTRAATPIILDTTLVLNGSWKMNSANDSILLVLDTCRIIDTTKNTLEPRPVRGQVVPVFVSIFKNKDGYNEWDIALTDFVPLAPLLGINLSGVPSSLLDGILLALYKTSQAP